MYQFIYMWEAFLVFTYVFKYLRVDVFTCMYTCVIFTQLNVCVSACHSNVRAGAYRYDYIYVKTESNLKLSHRSHLKLAWKNHWQTQWQRLFALTKMRTLPNKHL